MRAECLFLDVGQGTANAIILGGGRSLLIIDTGPHATRILNDLIRDYEFHSIECVLLSHNDADHVKGWEQIARQFGSKIQRIYLLQDRPLEKGNVLDLTMDLASRGVIPRPMRAEVRNLSQPESIWISNEIDSMRLELLYPDMVANLHAQENKTPNRTSAIAIFYCGSKSILFPGDSTIESWSCLTNTYTDHLPIAVDILVVPHHGGFLGADNEKEALQALFTKTLHAKAAVVSVGTTNRFGHPRGAMIEALREAGVRIICTEITDRCHNSSLPKLKPGVLNNIHKYSFSRTDPAHVACAGTVVATVNENDVIIKRLDEHRIAVETVPAQPQCIANDTSL